MKLIRLMFLAAAVLLPTSWTLAHAGDEAAPAGEATEKKTKKSKKSKKADGTEEKTSTETTKTETK